MCWVQNGTVLALAAGHLPGHRTIIAVAECKLWLVDRPEHDSPRMRQRRSEPASRVPPQLESAMLKAWERLLCFEMLQSTPLCVPELVVVMAINYSEYGGRHSVRNLSTKGASLWQRCLLRCINEVITLIRGWIWRDLALFPSKSSIKSVVSSNAKKLLECEVGQML